MVIGFVTYYNETKVYEIISMFVGYGMFVSRIYM